MRLVIPAVVVSVLSMAFAAPAAAQQPKPINTSVAVTTNVFSKASIDRAVAATITAAPKSAAVAKAAPVPRNGKSFWKSPWPYIIAGGVTAAVIIAVNAGNNNGTSGGIY